MQRGLSCNGRNMLILLIHIVPRTISVMNFQAWIVIDVRLLTVQTFCAITIFFGMPQNAIQFFAWPKTF